jgi:hypothetical protein
MKELKDRYEDARSYWSEWRQRALEDLKFSNPANPQQWDETVINARGKNRPALVFDQTNQYIGQVVNDARQNKPSIDVLPGDSKASDEAADVYGGLIRQIEYASRAQIAYDTGIEYAARIGMGFVLVVPELIDGKTNDHDIRIKAVVDPLAATLDPDSIEPDGQDSDCGWLDTRISEAAFKRRWPKADTPKPIGDRWNDGNGLLVCQYFERIYTKSNRIITTGGKEYGEDDYHEANKSLSEKLPVHDTYMATVATTKWRWMSGNEILEEADYPAPYIGLVPVYGNVLWVDGKRQVCGMTRRMMDAQRAYNYERSSYIEAVALSPKAPWLAPAAAITKYQSRWEASNRENAAVLPYDHLDANGQPVPTPTRQAPPMVGSAFAENAQMALMDIQASVGMYKANLGQNSNAKSGVAINKLQTEGDTATFHYIDNLARTIEQVGRICVSLIPTYYDRQRVARMLSIDGKAKAVQIDPNLETAHQPGDILSVNPAIGSYDVRVKTGPSYTSLRQEMSDRLVEISQGNPQLGAAMAPLLLQQSDMPGAEKAAKVALSLLPPEVRKAYDDEDGQPEVPPQVMAEMQGMQQQMQQMHGMLQQAAERVKELEAEVASNFNEQLIKAYDAETKRITALGTGMTQEQVQALAMQTVMEAMNSAPPDPIPPDGMQQEMNEAPQGAFSLPEPPQGDGMDYPPEMAATGANPGLGEQPILPEGM